MVNLLINYLKIIYENKVEVKSCPSLKYSNDTNIRKTLRDLYYSKDIMYKIYIFLYIYYALKSVSK